MLFEMLSKHTMITTKWLLSLVQVLHSALDHPLFKSAQKQSTQHLHLYYI